ncbi:hypothetical protein ACH492_28260 [Streptomyces sp. NPDC019443]|uniref:hypothetical protein n=1 Tax=Streptomyces sp. NPDC019443 TaxID=3365061 RepID=UPI0037985D01
MLGVEGTPFPVLSRLGEELRGRFPGAEGGGDERAPQGGIGTGELPVLEPQREEPEPDQGVGYE